MDKKYILAGALVLVLVFMIASKPKTDNEVKTMETVPTPTQQETVVPEKMISLEEIATHSTKDSCWLAIDGVVYDATKMVPNHPNDKILNGCGKDATTFFRSVAKHEEKAVNLLPGMAIGKLATN